MVQSFREDRAVRAAQRGRAALRNLSYLANLGAHAGLVPLLSRQNPPSQLALVGLRGPESLVDRARLKVLEDPEFGVL